MNLPSSGEASFVVFPLGGRHFALPTTEVLELPGWGSTEFPHTTPALEGVLVCRGESYPFESVHSPRLNHLARKYWLVTRRNFAGEERTAIPVTGECPMLQAEMVAPPEGVSRACAGSRLAGRISRLKCSTSRAWQPGGSCRGRGTRGAQGREVDMNSSGTYGRIFVVDPNLFFVKRLTEALRQQGFEVVSVPSRLTRSP